MCKHAGKGMPTEFNTSVMVDKKPSIVLSATFSITGCTFLPPTGNGPCATAKFTVGTKKVKSKGKPLLFLDSKATCTPTTLPLDVISANQTKVKAK